MLILIIGSKLKGHTLTNNDILRRLRYTFNFNDRKMVAIFALVEVNVTVEQVGHWLKKEDEQGFTNCPDVQLAHFLNGLIIEKRGRKDGPLPVAEKRLNNNLILTKLKIALNLKAEEIVELLASVDMRIGKSELSAFFRKSDHKHFRECKDQFLRNFLQAIQNKFRKDAPAKTQHKANTNPVDKTKATAKKSAQAKTKPAKKEKQVYINPNAKPTEKAESKRKVLKLKPEDIWK